MARATSIVTVLVFLGSLAGAKPAASENTSATATGIKSAPSLFHVSQEANVLRQVPLR
jgi:hypothetical protein